VSKGREVKNMFGWEHGYAGFWWIVPIVIFIMIFACVVMMRGCSCMAGRHLPGDKTRRSTCDSAEEILNKRYALGEIDRKEYEEIKAMLTRKDERPDR
jgi:uncharacterized membrane protein